MSALNQTVKLGMDTSQFEQGCQTVINLLAAQSGGLENAKLKMIQFNAGMQPIRATFEGINAAGQKVTQDLETRAGSITVMKTKMVDASAEIERAANKAAAATKKSAAESAAATNKLAKESEDASKRISGAFLVSIESLSRILEVQLFRRTITNLITSLQMGVKAAYEFQIAIQQVNNTTGIGAHGMQQLEEQVRRTSEAFNVTPMEALNAASIALGSTLGNTAQSFNILNNAGKLSIATGTSIEAASRLITTTLEAYGLSAEQAGRATEGLYVIAQRSKIPLDQLQNSIGRVGSTARSLGLSFEQVSAMYLTLAQQGKRPIESMGALNQVMARLIEPGKELREIFASWGVTTAEQAIRSYTLSGVLNKLNEEMRKSPERMHEVAGSLRTLITMLGLTGDQSIRLGENLSNLGTGTDLNAAVSRVQNTPAARLRQQIQELRNLFTQDIGKNILGGLAPLVEGMGGLVNVLGYTVTLVKSVTSALIASTAAMALNAVAATQGASSMRAFGMATRIAFFEAKQAILSNIIVLSVVAITSIILGVTTALDKLKAESRKRSEEAIEVANRALDRLKEATAQANEEESRQTNTKLAEAFAPINNAYANLLKQSRAFEEELQATNITIVGTFRANAQNALEGVRNKLQEINKDIGTFRREMEGAAKNLASFDTKSRQQTFETALHYEQDPIARQRLIAQRRAQLEQELRQQERVLANPNTTPENFSAAAAAGRERLGQLQQLATQQQQARYTAQRAMFEQQVRAGNVQPTTNLITGQQEYVMRVNIRDLEQDTLRVRQQQYQYEQLIVAAGQRRAQQLEEERRQQEAASRAAERTFAALAQYRALGREGQINAEYTRRAERRGTTPEAEARAEFERRAQAALAATPQAQRVQAIASIEQLRQNVNQQLTARTNTVRIQSEQERSIRDQRDLERQNTDLSNRLTEQQNAANTRRTGLGTSLERIRGATSSAAITINSPEIGTLEILREVPQDIRRAIDAAINTTTQLLHRFQQAPTEANEASINQTLNILQNLITQHRLGGEVLTGGRTIDQTITSVRNQLGTFAMEAVRAQTTRAQRDRVRTQATQLAGRSLNIPPELARSLQAANQNSSAVAVSMSNVQERMAASVRSINELNLALQQTRLIANQIVLPQARPVGAPVVNPPNRAPAVPNPNQPLPGGRFGGVVPRFVLGGSVGTDNQLIWASPGEIVMNRNASDKYYTQLLAMNRGIDPSNVNNNQNVNVGDIHIHVSGGQTSETTVRDIGRQLRREIQRGTISLS